ncbi:MAG TPA: GGDEF domain-containing protein [Xanthobacteraceae bacterium]|jgi:diguanylate cyclase|nr:GGDEF domain-containing protein [Xanthobacteraceae bacterium]
MNAASTNKSHFVHATSMAGRALQLMAQHKVPATPQNFEIWFTFSLGTMPELNKTINILIANKREFDGATNRSLFLSYIGAQTDWDATHGEVPDQLRQVLSSAQGFLAPSTTGNRKHVQALDGVGTRTQDVTDPRAIIQDLTGALTKAMTRATTLQAHFNASLQELDNIRNHLAAAEQRSKTDALTGLANRHALDEFLRNAQIVAMESGEPLSIFLLDIDHFKSFNDEFGHQFGDEVLQLISRILRDGVRARDLTARYGGEELAGVLPGADLRVCSAVAERIRQAISKRQVTRRTSGKKLSSVTVSIGVAQFVPGETLASLFERCDRALYAAKHRGRNRTVTECEIPSDAAA